MKNIRVFLSEKFQFLEVKFSIQLNRLVFVMLKVNKRTLELIQSDPYQAPNKRKDRQIQ